MFKFMYLSDINKWIEEIVKQKVSEVARSKKGFLSAYKKVNGDPSKLSENWIKKRNSFISRTLASYKKKPTYRRFLSLIAWAFMPKFKFKLPY